MDDYNPRHHAHRVHHMLPRNFTREQLDAAVAEGLIPKSALKDGVMYFGYCRNAEYARWDAAKQVFVYTRTKFGSSFQEDIKHPEDDDGFDIFAAIKEIKDI